MLSRVIYLAGGRILLFFVQHTARTERMRCLPIQLSANFRIPQEEGTSPSTDAVVKIHARVLVRWCQRGAFSCNNCQLGLRYPTTLHPAALSFTLEYPAAWGAKQQLPFRLQTATHTCKHHRSAASRHQDPKGMASDQGPRWVPSLVSREETGKLAPGTYQPSRPMSSMTTPKYDERQAENQATLS